MSDIQAQISVLKQTADPAVADAVLRLIEHGEDHELNRINALDFSKRHGLDEEQVISAFLHSARLGLFDLTWNVLCPGCSGVLGAHDTLKSLSSDDYHCALCACGYKASVDEQVEVAFTVSPRVRRIAAHHPELALGLGIFQAGFLELRGRSEQRVLCLAYRRSDAGYARIASRREGDHVAASAK